MSFRIVKINNRCKLETQLNYLVCRSDKESRILLDDISVLIIENQQVCITSALLAELVNHKVRVIFCDSKHNPLSELVPQHGAYNTYERIKSQLNWSQEIKDIVWANIIKQKIHNQHFVLGCKEELEACEILRKYENDISIGDSTNREGLAAKTYFSSIFGCNFDRRKGSEEINTYLDYGYSMILSAVNREVSCAGYLPSFGIHHIGSENPFNLGCDLMEPFRPFVDYMIVKNMINKIDYKKQLVNVLNMEISCNGKTTILINAIYNFVTSVFNALNNLDTSKINIVEFLNEQL